MKEVIIGQKSYWLVRRVREAPGMRDAFFSLARQTFDLDFRPWFDGGYWGERYLPYTLFDGRAAVSNVSVNLMDTCFDRRTRRYIQIGTVMTDPAYRGRGLCRFLMETVLHEWREKCAAIYLYANDNARGFYPRFGFAPADEWIRRRKTAHRPAAIRRLDMGCADDRALLWKLYDSGNPFSVFPMLHNRDLLMFYCAQSLREQIFFIEDCGVVAVAEVSGGELLCYDVFGRTSRLLDDILSALTPPGIHTVALGFTPQPTALDNVRLYKEEDSTLFIQGENLLAEHRLMFPLLSHT